MTVTYPSTYTITADGALVLPLADAAPLSTANANANCHYQQHRPPLRSVVYCSEQATSSVFRLAMEPSADGLVYRFRHYVRTDATATDVTIEVESQAAGGGWSTIYGPTAHAAGASSTVAIDHDVTIPATDDELRVTYTRGADLCQPDSLVIYPTPTSPTTRRTSGFWPYDDGLLTATGAPLNTEFVNRPWRNTAAVVADRVQCLFGFVQPEGAAQYDLTGTTTADGGWVLLGQCIAQVPYAPSTITVTVATIASVSAGVTADRVRMTVGGVSTTLDADDTVQTASVVAPVEQAGTMQASVTIEVYASYDSGQTLDVIDAAAWYTPIALASAATSAVDPPASMALLHAVVRETERRCMALWAMPAHCFDVSASTERRWVAVIPPGCQRGRMALVRMSESEGALQSATTLETTTTSGVPASPGTAIVTVPTSARGTAAYLDAVGGECAPLIEWSSDSYDVSGTPPASTVDRQVELVEALAAGTEIVQTTNAQGAALHITRIRAQSEYGSI